MTRLALIGNPNCGKTTLFNRLTGANQRVGNYPGVTVACTSGNLLQEPDVELWDLPGLYSLASFSPEERVARDALLVSPPELVLCLVDAALPERGLYLTLQLLELGLPTVVLLNRMDALHSGGGDADADSLSVRLGVPVLPVSALRGTGLSAIGHTLRTPPPPPKPPVLPPGFTANALRQIEALVERQAAQTNRTPRYEAACRFSDPNADNPAVRAVLTALETQLGMDPPTALATLRYRLCEELTASCFQLPEQSKAERRSIAIDRLLLHPALAYPCLFLMLAAVFRLTFGVPGSTLRSLLGSGLDAVSRFTGRLLDIGGVGVPLKSLCLDGILASVGGVLEFLPTITILFLLLSLLEDSGYLARAAFLMDRPMRSVGLTGKSAVPILLGFGCTVPAVLATRALPCGRDKRMTILLLPFLSCSAKLPVYVWICAACFPHDGATIAAALYLCGIALGILVAISLRRLVFPGQAAPYLLELPDYRLPTLRNTLRLLRERVSDFLRRTFSVVFLAGLAVWLLRSLDITLHWTDDPESSLLAVLGGILAPLLGPTGFGSWQTTSALLSGLLAKEAIVGTLEVLTDGPASILSPPAALSFLVFTLLYTPCIAALQAVRRELRSATEALGMALFQCAVAWLAASVVYRLAL